MKIEFFKKKKKFKKGGFGIKPDLYWKYILSISFVLMVLFCVFGFYFFVKTNRDLNLATQNGIEQQMISKERINGVLDYFSAREKKSNEILNSPSPVIDPSL